MESVSHSTVLSFEAILIFILFLSAQNLVLVNMLRKAALLCSLLCLFPGLF